MSVSSILMTDLGRDAQVVSTCKSTGDIISGLVVCVDVVLKWGKHAALWEAILLDKPSAVFSG